MNYMEWATYSKLARLDYFLVTEMLLNLEREIENKGGERLTDALYYTRRFEYPWVYLQIPTKAQRILDAGGGPATFQYLLSKKFPFVFNVDLNPEWVDKVNRTKRATGMFGNLTIQLGDISSLDGGSDGFFDVTTCVSVVEHGEDLKSAEIIDELLRVTDGPILLTVDVGFGDSQLLSFTRLYELAQLYGFEIPERPPDIIRGKTARGVFFEVACINLERGG